MTARGATDLETVVDKRLETPVAAVDPTALSGWSATNTGVVTRVGGLCAGRSRKKAVVRSRWRRRTSSSSPSRDKEVTPPLVQPSLSSRGREPEGAVEHGDEDPHKHPPR